MAKRKKIDHAKLVKMVKDKVDQKKIMQHFNFSTATQLKLAYANALMVTGEAPEIVSAGAAKPSNEISREVTVGKRGSLIIPKGLVAELGFAQGDAFTIRKSNVGVSLSAK
jgi:hypothetical protein